jgi:uncharacterized protein (TIGR03437 family)
VPANVSGANAQVFVQYQNQTSAALTMPLVLSAPGLFTANSSGQGQASALNQDGSLNSAANPARVGSTISLFATGLRSSATVSIGGKAVAVQSVSNGTTGVSQITVQVPSGTAAGSAVPVTVQSGGASGQNGVTIAVTGS